MPQDYKQFKINIPDEMKLWLADQAKQNMRSQSSEILLAIREKMHRTVQTEKADARA